MKQLNNPWLGIEGYKCFACAPSNPIGLKMKFFLDGEDILSAYDKFIHDNNIDVVSMTTHRRNLFSRLFNPSMARKMVFHTDTPMLVFHA